MSSYNSQTIELITQKLSDAGINMEKVYLSGKQDEYDAFWDAFQKNGKRLDYAYCFTVGWDNKTLLPKYDITVGSGYGVFYYCQYNGSLKELLERQGISLTFPNCYNISAAFTNSLFTEIGILDFSTVTQAAPGYIFNNCINLHTIEKIILSNVVSMKFSDWFLNCTALENIAFEGEIANDIDFHWSTKLEKDSIMNIINHLSDTVSDKTLTLSLEAVDREFVGVSPADWETIVPGSSSAEWYNIATFSKPNWQIVLG